MAVRKLELIIPGKLWEKLNEFEAVHGIRKEDILLRAVMFTVEGYRCPRCGNVIKVYE